MSREKRLEGGKIVNKFLGLIADPRATLMIRDAELHCMRALTKENSLRITMCEKIFDMHHRLCSCMFQHYSSTFNAIQCETCEACFLVARLHIETRQIHGSDDLIEGYPMFPGLMKSNT
jgi:hypothetical protein